MPQLPWWSSRYAFAFVAFVVAGVLFCACGLVVLSADGVSDTGLARTATLLDRGLLAGFVLTAGSGVLLLLGAARRERSGREVYAERGR